MKDVLDEVYQAMTSNEYIGKTVTNRRISYYEYPESKKIDGPIMIITPLNPPAPDIYGSNKELSQSLSIQIAIESTNRKTTKQIAKEAKQVLWDLGYSQSTGGLDEYFKETGRYVDARFYDRKTRLYDVDY